MVQDLTFKRYGRHDSMAEFTALWAVVDDCPIAQWCRDRSTGKIEDYMAEFEVLITEHPATARVAHYHIAHLLDTEIQEMFLRAILTHPVQAARMWLLDTTINEDQASRLYDVFMDPVTGASAYRDKVLSGEYESPLRNQYMNADSEIVGCMLEAL